MSSTSAVAVAGAGGNGLTAFNGTNSGGSKFKGEFTSTDSSTGVFLLSPDKQYVLGYSINKQNYFAGSK